MHEIIQETAAHVRGLLSGDSSGHDWFHIERVRLTALTIGREEGADLAVVELAALLHDVADWKFAGGDHTAGPRAAREWLERQGADAALINHVCQIIAGLSFKGAGVPTPMATLEGQVVQDADRLDALGAIGIARTFAYGGHKGQPMHDPAIAPQPHASFDAYKRGGGTTINHFYEKLLLLAERMNTRTGKRLAAQRQQYMERFLEQFLAEWKGER
ncbi:MAG: HD domain-containing protein [Planctomycetaceae bacterium]|nr:HD domain-containing protein [Planctomycetaceae bacterium]